MVGFNLVPISQGNTGPAVERSLPTPIPSLLLFLLSETLIVGLSDFMGGAFPPGEGPGPHRFPDCWFPTKHRWSLPGTELGAMESLHSIFFFFYRKMCAAKSGSPGNILAA